MVERRSLSEPWLGREAGSVTQFLSQFLNLLLLANGGHSAGFCHWVSVLGGKQGNRSTN